MLPSQVRLAHQVVLGFGLAIGLTLTPGTAHGQG
jgi:hypothetical protein